MTKQKQSLIISFLIGFRHPGRPGPVDQGTGRPILKGAEAFCYLEWCIRVLLFGEQGRCIRDDAGKAAFLLSHCVLVLGAVAYLICKMPPDGRYRPLAVCLMMISAGAVGNMIDRVSQGYVVDFLYFKLINFPIFNVADCYVTMALPALCF